MLSIARLAATGAADYFLSEVAPSADAYYTGAGEAPGRWVGSLSGDLGLSGLVEPEAFRALLEGRHPSTGEHLVCAPRHEAARRCRREGGWLSTAAVAERLRVSARHVRRLIANSTSEGVGAVLAAENIGTEERPRWRVAETEVSRYEQSQVRVKRRPGYDLTFRPPKSVSVLWAVSPRHREAIGEAHREAVEAALAYLEQSACVVRCGLDRQQVPGAGLVAAAFEHRTSRAGDPLLHTHVVVANLTRSQTGKWRALDARPLWWHARAAGFCYQSHLRHLLTSRLGLAWEPVRNGWANLVGVPQSVLDAFSKRRADIVAEVERFGGASARAYQAATLATRPSKEPSGAGLHERWAVEADSLGFTTDAAEHCFGQSAPSAVDQEAVAAELAGPHGLTAMASTFERRDVICAVAERMDAPAAEVVRAADRFLASDASVVLDAAGPGGRRFSTPELVVLESELISWASAEASGAPPRLSPDGVEVVLEGRGLSEEQATAVRAICSARGRVRVVTGLPGSGKTQATAALAAAFVAAGFPVAGVALSATAAAELEDACRLRHLTGRAASSISRLLFELDDPAIALPPGCVLIVDEASMAPTRALARMAAEVEAVDGAMVLVGDPDQHGAVEAGGLFRHLVGAGQITAELSANHRQRHEVDQAAIAAYRSTGPENALAALEVAGRLIRHSDAAAAREAMVAASAAGAGVAPMVAGSNHLRRQLNEAARQIRQENGGLTGPELVVGGRGYQGGDEVVARRNAAWLVGDAGEWLKNGSLGRVTSVDTVARELTVAFDREGLLVVPTEYLEGGHLDHAYARTTYGLQGTTVETASYQPTDASGFEEGYVALTRARQGTTVHIVDGDVEPDAEIDRPGTQIPVTGVDEVVDALRHRRANELAAELDPRASSAVEFQGWRLPALDAEAARLDRALRDTPPDVRGALARAERRVNGLEARLARLQSSRWLPSRGKANLSLAFAVESARVEVRRLRGVDDRRRQWVADHQEELARRAAVRRAISARLEQLSHQVRSAPHDPLLSVLGKRPVSAPDRGRWDRAAVDVLASRERGRSSPDPSEPATRRWYTASLGQTSAL